MMIKRANTIYEDGATDCGYFMREWLAGFIMGVIISVSILTAISGLVDISMRENNYVIPKNKCRGLYLQLDDGRLYKEQKRGN